MRLLFLRIHNARGALFFVKVILWLIPGLPGGFLDRFRPGRTADAHGADHELRDVERLEERPVALRVFLRQDERLAFFPVFEIAEVGAGIGAVVAARAEDDPRAVRGPAVVAVRRARLVGRGEGAGLAGREVHQVEVGALMPNVKRPVVAEGEQQVFAIGRDAGEGRALAQGRGSEDRVVGGGKGPCRRVESLSVDVVMEFPVMVEERVFFHRDALGVAGGDEIERSPVGAPGGEGLQLVGLVLEGVDDVALRVVEDQPRGQVHHLNLLPVFRVEMLPRRVGRVGDEGEGRVPSGVDAVRGILARFQVDFPDLAIGREHCPALIAPHVELHVSFLVIILIVMAIDASPAFLFHRPRVVDQDSFLEIGQVALVQAHVFVEHVQRLDEAIGEVGIDRLGGDVVANGGVAKPLAIC